MKKVLALIMTVCLSIAVLPCLSRAAEPQPDPLQGALIGAFIGAAVDGCIGLAIYYSQKSSSEKEIKKDIEEEKQKLQGEKHSLGVSVFVAEGTAGPILLFRF